MTKEQRERVEDALISMIENVPSMNIRTGGEPKAVSADCMKAAAELTYALIALQESEAVLSPSVRVCNTVGGKVLSTEGAPLRGITLALRGITLETPNCEDGD